MNDLVRSVRTNAGDDANRPYYAELERLTAEGWRRSG
jgi:hypothetical protein